MINPKRSRLQFVLELTISSIFLILALWGIDFSGLWKALKHANYLWLFPSIISVIILLIIKSWRWQLLFHPEHKLPFGTLFTALSAGFFISNILPARLGEVSRVLMVVGEQPVGVARTTSTIIIEHLLDLATLMFFLLLLLPFISLPPVLINASKILGILTVFGIIVMIFLSMWRMKIIGWMDNLSTRLTLLKKDAIRNFIIDLIDGFTVIRTRTGILIIGISLFGWILVFITGWSASLVLNLDIPIIATMLAVVVTTLGMLVPSSPGYIGVFHYLVFLSLSPFGIAKETSLALALLWHAVNYLTLTGSGYVALWLHGTSLGQILKKYRNGTII